MYTFHIHSQSQITIQSYNPKRGCIFVILVSHLEFILHKFQLIIFSPFICSSSAEACSGEIRGIGGIQREVRWTFGLRWFTNQPLYKKDLDPLEDIEDEISSF